MMEMWKAESKAFALGAGKTRLSIWVTDNRECQSDKMSDNLALREMRAMNLKWKTLVLTENEPNYAIGYLMI